MRHVQGRSRQKLKTGGHKYMDNRLRFDVQCPYCKEHSAWLFAHSDVGDKLVDCEHCGKPYMFEAALVPKVKKVYALVEQID